MSTINGVDFDAVGKQALDAVRVVLVRNFDQASDIVESVVEAMERDVVFLAKKKASGELNEMDARDYMDQQRILLRMRLTAIPEIGLLAAQQAWNAIAGVFRSAILSALGWTAL